MTRSELFGKALWIGADGATRTPCFRASFDAPAAASAELTICGLGNFACWINGEPVSEDLFVPATSDYAPRDIRVRGQPFDEETAHRCYCLRYPVAPLLRPGRNELAVALGPGFYAQETWSFDGSVSYGEVRLIYRLHIVAEDGAQREIVSDGSEWWRQGVAVACDFFTGEKQDLRLLPEDWTRAPYDDWLPVRLLPDLETAYQLQDCPADGVVRALAPRLVREFATCRVYDAGENITGWVVLQDESAAGETVRLAFSEGISAAGALDEHYIHGQLFEAVSDGRGRTLRPMFVWNGFRYFSVRGRARPLRVEVVHSRVAVASSFSCADETLNWLYAAYLRTQLGNLHGGIPSDCPHIERRGYTGDGQLTCETALLALDYAAFLRKWLRDIAGCQDRRSGHVQYTAPYTRCGGGPGGWGCAIITAPWQYYRHTGDPSPLREMYPGMRRYIDYLVAHSEGGLVVSDREGEWCLGDWCAPGLTRLPPPFVNTCLMLRSLALLRRIEAALGLEEDARWRELARMAGEAVRRAYYDGDTGSFCGGMEGADAFAVDAGLDRDGRAWRALVARYERLGHYDTGIFGTEVLTRLLFARGEAALAFRLMTTRFPTSFHGWMEAGATTLWEYWPGDGQRSLNHPMFGAAVKELFHSLLGIRQKEESAGWREVVVSPLAAGVLPWAKGHITTPRGPLAVEYEPCGAGVRLCADIPAGTRATLSWQGEECVLPAGRSEHILPAARS